MLNMKNELKAYKVTGEALAYWLNKTGMKQTDLADAVGVEQGTISNFKRGARGMNGEMLEKVSEALGITIPEFFMKDAADMPEIVFVDLVKARPRAGTGGLEVDGGMRKRYSFHRSFIERKGGNIESMKLFVIDGDSMEPTLRNNDMVMINERLRDIRSGGVYLVRHQGDLMIKRLVKTSAREIGVLSDNKDLYPPVTVDLTNGDLDFEVFGRMVWSCREY